MDINYDYLLQSILYSGISLLCQFLQLLAFCLQFCAFHISTKHNFYCWCFVCYNFLLAV